MIRIFKKVLNPIFFSSILSTLLLLSLIKDSILKNGFTTFLFVYSISAASISVMYFAFKFYEKYKNVFKHKELCKVNLQRKIHGDNPKIVERDILVPVALISPTMLLNIEGKSYTIKEVELNVATSELTIILDDEEDTSGFSDRTLKPIIEIYKNNGWKVREE